MSFCSWFEAPPRERRGLSFPCTVRRHGGTLFTAAVLLALLQAPAARADEPEAPRFGREVARRWGIGMLSPTLPAGVRYHFDHRLGAEVGLRFGSRSVEGSSRNDFAFEGALLYVMAPGDRLNFYLRPAAGFLSEERGDGTYSTVVLSAGFLFEVFLTRDFSVSASQGLAVEFVGPPSGRDSASGNRTSFGLRGGTWPQLGFTYYLP